MKVLYLFLTQLFITKNNTTWQREKWKIGEKIMRDKLTREEYEQIKDAMYCAFSAPNKKEAKRYINKIHSFSYDLIGSARNILSEVESYAAQALGRARDKEHWVECAKSSLYKLEFFATERE